ncbi:hypothetical protein F4X10_02350 [Candidatus Poribacteria bacterium]|nr:hypothetical protein [Candidatus Poribacteria bacterium]
MKITFTTITIVFCVMLAFPSEPSQLRSDVNEDGVVNIIDLTLVASNFGERGENTADVNGDGVVNITDLTLVAAAFGNTTQVQGPPVWQTIIPQQEFVVGVTKSVNLLSFVDAGYPSPSFSVKTGQTLPAGLRFDNGVVSGSPITVGHTDVIFVASNTVGGTRNNVEKTISFRVHARQGPTWETDSDIRTVAIDTNYSLDLNTMVTAYPRPTISRGSILIFPPGLTLANGILSGTPTRPGKYQLTFIATNSEGTASLTFTLQVQAPPVWQATIPQQTFVVGVTKSVNLLSFLDAGFPAPTFSVKTSEVLPAGFRLVDSILVAVPEESAASTRSITIVATNAQGSTEKTIGLNITVDLPTIRTVPSQSFEASTEYSLDLNDFVTSAARVTFQVDPRTPLPAGLTLTNGVISGRATVIGTSVTRIVVSNSASSVDLDIGFNIQRLTRTAPNFASTLPIAQNGNVNVRLPAIDLSQHVRGSIPIIFSVKTGSTLPAGLTLEGSIISGIPTAEIVNEQVTVIAKNSVASDEAIITYTVGAEPVYQAPNWKAIPDQLLRLGQEVSLNISSYVTGHPEPDLYFTPIYSDGRVPFGGNPFTDHVGEQEFVMGLHINQRDGQYYIEGIVKGFDVNTPPAGATQEELDDWAFLSKNQPSLGRGVSEWILSAENYDTNLQVDNVESAETRLRIWVGTEPYTPVPVPELPVDRNQLFWFNFLQPAKEGAPYFGGIDVSPNELDNNPDRYPDIKFYLAMRPYGTLRVKQIPNNRLPEGLVLITYKSAPDSRPSFSNNPDLFSIRGICTEPPSKHSVVLEATNEYGSRDIGITFNIRGREPVDKKNIFFLRRIQLDPVALEGKEVKAIAFEDDAFYIGTYDAEEGNSYGRKPYVLETPKFAGRIPTVPANTEIPAPTILAFRPNGERVVGQGSVPASFELNRATKSYNFTTLPPHAILFRPPVTHSLTIFRSGYLDVITRKVIQSETRRTTFDIRILKGVGDRGESESRRLIINRGSASNVRGSAFAEMYMAYSGEGITETTPVTSPYNQYPNTFEQSPLFVGNASFVNDLDPAVRGIVESITMQADRLFYMWHDGEFSVRRIAGFRINSLASRAATPSPSASHLGLWGVGRQTVPQELFTIPNDPNAVEGDDVYMFAFVEGSFFITARGLSIVKSYDFLGNREPENDFNLDDRNTLPVDMDSNVDGSAIAVLDRSGYVYVYSAPRAPE